MIELRLNHVLVTQRQREFGIAILMVSERQKVHFMTRKRTQTVSLGFWWISILMACMSGLAEAGPPDSGYPRPVSFRKITPELVPQYDWIQMAISDMHVHTRKNAAALFKARYPERPVLIQINCEGLGLWGSWESVPRQRFEDLGLLDPGLATKAPALEIFSAGIYPLPDFLGYWTYDAGATTLEPIPAGQEIVKLCVSDAAVFRPNDAPVTIRELKARVGQESYMKDVVICPLKAGGERDWLNAELASTTAVDLDQGTITVRRWHTGKLWRNHPAGTYVAPHSVLTYPYTFLHALDLTSASKATKFLQPFLPNLTRYCPRDPRTGLNAAEWLARHYAKVKRENYSEADGFVFDVSVGTYYPSGRVSERVDCNNNGEVDNFLFDGVNHWPLGIFDFFRLLREGRDGAFKGLGDELILASDSNSNEDQRFFSLLNGGEYEHSMLIHGPFSRFMYSSRIDRLLLWAQRGRKPDVTFIDNKYPDQAYHGGNAADLKGPMTLSAFRLDMASACMGSGYVGKGVGRVTGDADPELAQYPGQKAQRRQFGSPLPLDYDEYHQGTDNVRGWLGEPVSSPVRLTSHLSPVLYRFGSNSPLPVMRSKSDPWRAAPVERVPGNGLRLSVKEVGLWHSHRDSFKLRADLPLQGVQFKKHGEYSLKFRVRHTSPFKHLDAAYASIPRNITLRLVVNGTIGERNEVLGFGYMQEALVFEEEREVVPTMIAPADGEGILQLGLAENRGEIQIRDLELREGCPDVLARRFENGLVILNGSTFSPATVCMRNIDPSGRYRRIHGTQDPVHNNGKIVGEAVDISPQDAAFFVIQSRYQTVN